VYLIGALLAALSTKFLLETVGRKYSLVFIYIMTNFGANLVFSSYFPVSSICLLIKEFFYGVQAGLATVVVPIYLHEIAPTSLSGFCGTFHYLFFSIGMLFAYLSKYVFKKIGKRENSFDFLWHVYLSSPFLMACVGSLLVIFLFLNLLKCS
jgi:MFS family permease